MCRQSKIQISELYFTFLLELELYVHATIPILKFFFFLINKKIRHVMRLNTRTTSIILVCLFVTEEIQYTVSRYQGS